jgi:hypothetical protein
LEPVISLKAAQALDATAAYADDGSPKPIKTIGPLAPPSDEALARRQGAVLDTLQDMKLALPTSEGKTPRPSTLLRSDGDVEGIAVDGA